MVATAPHYSECWGAPMNSWDRSYQGYPYSARWGTLCAVFGELTTYNSACVVKVRKLHQLDPVDSPAQVHDYFSWFGAVAQVFMVHSQPKVTSRYYNQNTRIQGKPSGLGFVVMKDLQSVHAILACGAEHPICGVTVLVEDFSPACAPKTVVPETPSSSMLPDSMSCGWPSPAQCQSIDAGVYRLYAAGSSSPGSAHKRLPCWAEQVDDEDGESTGPASTAHTITEDEEASPSSAVHSPKPSIMTPKLQKNERPDVQALFFSCIEHWGRAASPPRRSCKSEKAEKRSKEGKRGVVKVEEVDLCPILAIGDGSVGDSCSTAASDCFQ